VSGSGINNNACTFISPLMSLAQVPLFTSDSDSDEAFLVRLAPRQATCTRTRPAIKNWMVQHRPSKRTCVGVCGVGLGTGIQGFGRSGVQGSNAFVTPTRSGLCAHWTATTASPTTMHPHDAASVCVSVLGNEVVDERAPSLSCDNEARLLRSPHLFQPFLHDIPQVQAFIRAPQQKVPGIRASCGAHTKQAPDSALISPSLQL